MISLIKSLLNKTFLYDNGKELDIRRNKWLNCNEIVPILNSFYYLLNSYDNQLSYKIDKYKLALLNKYSHKS